MVRAATIAVRAPPRPAPAQRLERVLALWLPGESRIAADPGLGFELPASAELVVRVLYRKTWEYERKELRDRSTIGLYFAPAADDRRFRRCAWRRTRHRRRHCRALRVPPYACRRRTGRRDLSRGRTCRTRACSVVARRPDGTRADLIAFRPRPDWLRRYWFREPIPLPRGTTIETSVLFDDETPLLPLSLSPATATRPDLSSMRLTLNVVP